MGCRLVFRWVDKAAGWRSLSVRVPPERYIDIRKHKFNYISGHCYRVEMRQFSPDMRICALLETFETFKEARAYAVGVVVKIREGKKL